jgi:sulfite reductase (NADPH) flavoprotein alpha-component
MPFLLKRLLFRTHWLLGIPAGLVLAVVGVTGALLSYEAELLDLLNPQFRLEAAGRVPLPPDRLIAIAAAAYPTLTVRSIAGRADPSAPLELRLARGAERGGTQVFIDPYSGDLLGAPRGADFFHTSEQLHRFLAAGPVGKQIVGASTVALIVLALTGVVLRWPRRWRSPRAWLALDTGLRGRSLLWHLHAVLGTWALAFHLLAALTGLWWSYGFYRSAVNAIAGVPAPAGPRGAPTASPDLPAPLLSIDRAHAAFRAAAPEAVRFSANLPSEPDAPIEWRYFTADAPHERAADSLTIGRERGEIVARQAYADLPRGRRFIASMLPLHTGSWFGPVGRFGMMLASLAMPLFALTGLCLWLQRRRRARIAREAQSASEIGAGTAQPIDILHASQSGTAERLAWRTAQWLGEIGLAARVAPLGQWRPASAAGTPALFVVSTYGEGEPPDAARGFARRWMRTPSTPDLGALECGVLALGNRRYPDFCGFGRELWDWLHRSGARSWFERIDAHEAEDVALSHWREGLARRWPALRAISAEDASGAPYEAWRLDRRTCLNPASAASPLCELFLRPTRAGTHTWQPGALLEILGEDGVARRYSIASLPEQGEVRLLVRRLTGPDGRAGTMSSQLCGSLPLGETLHARLRDAPGFPPPLAARRALLIANGVGIAPFLGLLAQRAQQASAPAWLLHGERDPQTDAAVLPELEQALERGVLARLDLAWSRCASPAYVQDRLRESGDALRDFIGDNGEVRVCGSPAMGAAVDRVLADILGEGAMLELYGSGRYRRELF